MIKIKTFEECIAESKGKKHLVLGNGFSIDLFPEIFNYKRLAEKVTDPKMVALFKGFKTSDFEFVVLKLTECLKVIDHYDLSKLISPKVAADSEKLKQILIEVITESHPPNPSEIFDVQYDSCYEFLMHFDEGRKYTFNYDLLLYWVYMHFLIHPDKVLKMDDGFRTDESNDSMVSWQIGREHNQTLYYVHGAMHIFRSDSGLIEKYTWKNKQKTIAQQVKESIEKDKFPLFISEGTTEHKLKRIKESGYLSRGFSSVKSIKGDLFIFGHSLRDEDDHFFDVMNENKGINKVFISLFGHPESEANEVIIDKIDRWKEKYSSEKRDYTIYNSESAKVWSKFS